MLQRACGARVQL